MTEAALNITGMSQPSPKSFYPVIVVGAGPTGLTLANLLGRYGIETLIVERNASTVGEPRAVSIDDESLRTMQAAGLVEAIFAKLVPGYGSDYLSPSGRCFLKVEPTAAPYGFPRRNAFRQPMLEAQLRGGLARFPHIDSLFGWRIAALAQQADGVQVELAGPLSGSMNVACRYLIGADGASSTVRDLVGLTLDGETFAEQWLIVDLEDSPVSTRQTLVFCNPERPCIALPGPDLTRRFEFKLRPGETAEQILRPEYVKQLLASHEAHPDSKISRTVVYTFHARIAPVWSRGNVYLAGDACHLTPPFAGQGMNSGIRDAHNLAWKLAAVVRGEMGPGLLETYQAERRRHVREMIDLALRMGRIMAPKTRGHGALTRTFFHALAIWPAARSYFSEMKYKPKPRFLSGFQLTGTWLRRHPAVGRLLPQPTIITQSGEHRLLDEVLGAGFALIAVTDNPDRFVELTTLNEFERLLPVRICVSRGKASATDGAQIVHDPVGNLRRVIGPEAVVLVRPDRYVAAAFKLSDAKRLSGKLAALLKSFGPPTSTSATAADYRPSDTDRSAGRSRHIGRHAGAAATIASGRAAGLFPRGLFLWRG